MLLFALMSVLLLVIAGLAVDAGMSYLSSDQVERAAAAPR
jgi:Flp pilus assembly protein TadG